MMTHIETARVNEMLGLQIGAIRNAAVRLDANDLERLEEEIEVLDDALKKLREILAGLPHVV